MDTPTGLHNFVSFQSKLFSTEERDHYINPCCFCEDLALWLAKKLEGLLPSLAIDVYQEDFGWVVDCHQTEEKYVVMVIAHLLDGGDRATGSFAIWVTDRPPGFLSRIFRGATSKTLIENKRAMIRAIDSALHAQAGIRQVTWWEGGLGDGVPSAHADRRATS